MTAHYRNRMLPACLSSHSHLTSPHLLLSYHLDLINFSLTSLHLSAIYLHHAALAAPPAIMDATLTPTRNPHATPQPIPSLPDRVEAWTVSQAADVLSATSISTPLPTRGRPTAVVTLDIPLDDESPTRDSPPQRTAPSQSHTVYKRRNPIRRDSLDRRTALLKGKEGTRRRQRWENDRLLSNPHAQPPLPSDWEVRPTHNAHAVPYFLAPLWDAEYARKAAAKHSAKTTQRARNPDEAAAEKVARDLRAKLKRAQGAKGLLQDLEGEVRGFVRAWEAKQRQLASEGLIEETDSEDEEIVFVGRNGAMSDERKLQQAQQKEEETLKKDKLVFQSLIDDHGASFGYVLIAYLPALGGLCEQPLACLFGFCRNFANMYSSPQPLPSPRHRNLLRAQDLVRQHAGRQTRSLRRPQTGSGHEKAQHGQERAAQAALGCCMIMMMNGESDTI